MKINMRLGMILAMTEAGKSSEKFGMSPKFKKCVKFNSTKPWKVVMAWFIRKCLYTIAARKTPLFQCLETS